MKYRVLIRKRSDDEIIKTMEYASERQAERGERGVNINLDHEHYYTEIEEGEA